MFTNTKSKAHVMLIDGGFLRANRRFRVQWYRPRVSKPYGKRMADRRPRNPGQFNPAE